MPSPNGTVPPEIVQGFEAGLFQVPPHRADLGTSLVQSVWKVPVILVAFSDQPLGTTIYGGQTPARFFETSLFDTSGATATGSVFDYYRWVSGNRIRVEGKVVATITLPNSKNYYANSDWGLNGSSKPQNIMGFVSAALTYADPTVDWTQFDQDHDGYVDMVWVVHSGLPGEATVNRDNLWSLTSRLTSWPSGEKFTTHTPLPGAVGLKILVDRFSILPEISAIHPGLPSEIGVYCHEFGHALGLPDLYDTSVMGGARNMGPGNWNLMSTGGYGGDGNSPEYPAHLGAWSSLFLGWRQSVRPTNDTLIVQGPIESGAPVVEFWCQGESNPEHFLIENRQRLGFDRNLTKEGLLVYQVDETVIGLGLQSNRINTDIVPGLRLVEADGQYDIVAGRNRGDDHDPFPGYYGRTVMDDDTSPSTRSFRGAVTNIALRQIELLGTDARYFAQVRQPGWEAAGRPIASDAPSLAWPSGPANRVVQLADGSLAIATSEMRGGQSQIVVRTRNLYGPWGSPAQVSFSNGGASDPTLAALPGGTDLVVVWDDRRHGPGELYFRSRIRGVWTDERRLTDLEGDSRFPSIGVDRWGRVHLAWLYTAGGTPQVRFMAFSYFSPFGTSVAVTDSTSRPDPPVVAVAPDGGSYVLWPDRARTPVSIWFSHFHPDSSLTGMKQVATNVNASPAVDAVVDPSGALHIAWQVSGPGLNQIHYQRRPANGGLTAPLDTVIVSRAETVQNPVLRLDPAGGLHLVFLTNSNGVQEVRYKHAAPGRGWDYAAAEVTRESEGPALRASLLPMNPDEVSVFYIGFPNGIDSNLERRRLLPGHAVAVLDPPPAPPLSLTIGPNPLRAGTTMWLRWPASSETGPDRSTVEFYDLNGRRLAAVAVAGDERETSVELPGSITAGWKSGVYFARLRGKIERSARLVVIR
jgi:M6 family metalloprotease-like protein